MLLPGDRIKATRIGQLEHTAERWRRTFTWQKKEKRGKNTVITNMKKEATATWKVTWGQNLAGALTVGDRSIKFGQVVDGITLHAFAAGEAQWRTDIQPTARDVSRPADVPRHAHPSAVDHELLVADGQQIGTLELTIIRPSTPY